MLATKVLHMGWQALGVVAALFTAGLAIAAEPVLLPDFTPQSSNDYAVSIMLQEQVGERLLSDGHIVLTNDVVGRVIGKDKLVNCANSPGCPGGALAVLPVKVAVVVRVERNGATLVGHLEVFDRGNSRPAETHDLPIAPGNEHLFANAVAESIHVALRRTGPATEAEIAMAARIVAGQPVSLAPINNTAPVQPPIRSQPTVAPPPGPPIRAKTGFDPSAPLEEQLKGTGVFRRHLVGAEANYEKSGIDPRDWIYRTMPHAGRFIVSVSAGIGMGDVDRGGDIRVELDGNTKIAEWYQEYPVNARRARGGMFIGYAPATFIDFGVKGELQYGRRVFTTGTTRQRTNGPSHNVADPADVAAVAFTLQPRVRGYVVPLGPVKPFLFSGMEIKFFDGYKINQPVAYTYPLPQGAAVPGWVGGGGIMLDPSPIVGFFFEASYTRHFGDRAVLLQTGTWPYAVPVPSPPTEQTIGLAGGVQFRI